MEKLLKYRLTAPSSQYNFSGKPSEEAFVFMLAEHLGDDSLIQYEGPEALVKEIAHRVLRSYGFRARLIEEFTSPRDLHCVMQGRLLADYRPELVAGDELFAKPNG